VEIGSLQKIAPSASNIVGFKIQNVMQKKESGLITLEGHQTIPEATL
jgi:hypothetical protein